MSVIDLNQLLEPVGDEAPCGDDLEYDPAFGELERAVQGKSEQVMGDEVIEAEPPNWPEVQTQAMELLTRAKDIRIATYLTRALVNKHGLVGFGDGVALIHGLLDKFWDDVFPQLDKEDNNDPTMRVNAVTALCDPETVLYRIREAPIVRSKTLGAFSLTDVRIASGELSLPAGDDSTPPDSTHIEAAFQDCELSDLQETADAVVQSIGHIGAIETLVTEKVGVGDAPDLGAPVQELGEIQKILAEALTRRGVSDVPGADGDAATTSAQRSAISGEVNSREDVVRVLDKACEYFRRNEPSSPVPLLLQRAKRLVSKDFMEILKDLTPDAVSQAELIGGVEREE